MSFKRNSLSLILSSCLLTQAHAATSLEPIIVSATKTPIIISDTAHAVTVITAEDIANHQYFTLADALKAVSGLTVVQTGGLGSQTSVFVRGSNSDHALVIVDGIEMNDPSSPNGGFDFAHFVLDDVEQIEILKGAQSVLYGADALGGVIYITTQKGQGDLNIKAKLSAGMNRTHNESIFVSGAQDNFHYSAGIASLKSDGESTATTTRLADGDIEDDDGYDNLITSTQFGWDLNKVSSNFIARYIDSEVEIDGGFDWFGNAVNDPDAKNKSQQLFLSAQFAADFFEKKLQTKLQITHTDIERENRNNRQDPFGTLDRTDFSGEKTKLNLHNDFLFIQNHLISLGLEYEDEQIDSDGYTDFGGFIISQQSNADRQTRAVYLQDQISWTDNLAMTVAIRHDDPNDTASETTYSSTINYQLAQQSRLRASYGTAYKAPALFQLYGYTPNNFGSAYFGNPDLKPETSKGWELGFNHQLTEKVNVDVSYFDYDVDDLINTVFLPSFDSTTQNIDEADLRGVDATVEVALSPSINWLNQYSFLQTEDDQGQALLRRPKHKASTAIEFVPTNNLSVITQANYIGSRKDLDGFGTRVDMGGYTVFDMAINYQVNNTTKVSVKVDNLSNKRYESAYGFQAIGTAAYIGLELTH
jgi:vitamin B12 transporter